MRRFSQKVLRILDGSPGALGGHERGQSLVELILVTPLLIIMVAGIIEIGWYANHVLILLEVTRVGARQATLFTGEYGYQAWNNEASIHPVVYPMANGFDPVKPLLPTWGGLPGAVDARPVLPGGTTWPQVAEHFRDCDPDTLSKSRGFYNSVICSMMNALEPLSIKGRKPTEATIIAKRIRQEYNSPGSLKGVEYAGGRAWFTYNHNELFLFPDDIVVSVFSLQAINNAIPADRDKLLAEPTVDANLYARTIDLANRFPRGHQVIVVGRYPTNANECNVTFTPTVAPTVYQSSGAGTLDLNETLMRRVMTVGAVDVDYGFRSTFDSAASSMTAPAIPGGTYKYEIYDPANPNTYMFRDPFNYYGLMAPEADVFALPQPDRVGGRAVELAGFDTGAEIQRGFVYTGQHIANSIINGSTGYQLFCIGSDWSDQRVQDMMNSPSFLQKGLVMPPKGDPELADATWKGANLGPLKPYTQWQERARFLPSQGLVLVEMYWRHDILLDFPLMTPIIRLMEGAGGPYNIVISVWAVFPLPGAEPNMNFGFPPNK